MRLHFTLITLFLVFFSTSKAKDKEIEFVKLAKTKIVSINKDNLGLYTEAVIYNPYKLNAKVKSMHIDIYINDQKIGTITESEEVLVRKRQTTHIPLNIRSRSGSLAKNLFSQTGNLILGKIITIEYKGYIKLKALANTTNLKVKIDGREHIKMSDLIN